MGKPAENVAIFDAIRIGDTPAGDRDEPILDLVHLSRQTLGDAGLEAELLSLFDKQAQQLAMRLSQSGGAQESRQRAELAHMLKGSARAIGAFGVARAAEVYEDAVRAGATDVSGELRRLIGSLGAARGAIADLLERSR